MFRFITALLLTLPFAPVLAHTPLFDCFDNRDGSITCEGGFSDGGSAEGITVRVLDAQGKVLEQAALDAKGSVMLRKPEGAYTVVLEAGEGHALRVFGDDIY